MITELNIKLATEDLYKNTLTVADEQDYYSIGGISSPSYSKLIYSVQQVLENITPTELIEKLEMNNCTIRINGVDFKL